MASSREKYLYNVHLTAFTVVALLTGVVAWLLWPAGTPAMVRGVLIFAAVAVVLEQIITWVLVKQILAPTGVAASVAVRIGRASCRERVYLCV